MTSAPGAPRVLVAGAVLAQPVGGVRRRAAELLPRAGRLLAERGGGLAVLAGRDGIPFELPPEVAVLPSRVPAGPPIARAIHEERALGAAIAAARGEGRPFALVDTAHFPVPRRLSLPFTLTIHDLRSLALRHTPFSRRLVAGRVLGGAVRRAACTIVVSRTVEADVRERFAPRRLAVVPNAGDHLPRPERAPGRDAPLLAVGHVEPRKNLELLLLALSRAPDLPDLVLVGAERGDEGERLRRRAAELGVAARVRFAGAVDDARLAGLYATCAAVVLPSRLEGFGIPALEALRAGAPLAVAEAGALPEVAGPDVPRFAVDDAAACVAAVRAALATPADALAARRARAERSSWDAAAALLVDVWCRTVEEAASPR